MNIEQWEIRDTLEVYLKNKHSVNEICEQIESSSLETFLNINIQLVNFLENYVKKYEDALNHRIFVLKELSKTSEIEKLKQEQQGLMARVEKTKEKLKSLNNNQDLNV